MPASTGIPSFAQPPVAEVALSIQFAEPIPIEILDVAVVRDAFGDRYPVVQVKAPITEIEPNFDPLRLDVQLVDEVPLPLFWFLNDDNTELVQFQADRLTINWRRVGNEPYPRYAEAVRPMAVDAWTRLSRALGKLGLDEPKMGAAEMVYLNPITAGPGWGQGNELRDLLACWSGKFSDDFLPAPDDVRMNLRFTLPDEAGRLLISLQPTRSNTAREPSYMLQLVVRGRVDGNHAAAMTFFDLAREWIVRGFTSVTTPEMHALWGRNHDA